MLFDDDGERKPDPDYDEKARVALEKIQEAFGALKYPGEKAVRDGSTNPDIAELMAEFGSRNWTELAHARLMFHREALPIMGPVALRFYLPAYMRAGLTRERGASDIREYTLFALRPIRQTATEKAAYNRRVSLLDDAQKDAVQAFLHAIAADYGAWRSDSVMKEWGIR